ncbi:Metallo-hydrolase/oxidoreductase [Xylariaceae sp. FL0255]|nr:Metallo-hydrolase/oxidoreductase [Xylariaceae sp. FL0255]
MAPVQHLHLSPSKRQPLLRDQRSPNEAPDELPIQKSHKHPALSSPDSGPEDASVSFIGTATTIIEWQGLKILTDPNFLHKGDHVHLGPGVTAERLTNPTVDLHELPAIDLVLLSHYHEDHFDRLVEDSLNRDFPIVTTPHAKGCLTSSARSKGYEEGDARGKPFSNVHALDAFESLMLHIEDEKSGERPSVIKITGMPGKHVPPGPLAVVNDLLGAVPPTNGWLLEMGWPSQRTDLPSSPEPRSTAESSTANESIMVIEMGYTLYISGDTLFVDELQEIMPYLRSHQIQRQPRSATEKQEPQIDLMLIHLGGTTIPGPQAPLLMVTMDAKQGVKLMRLLNPDVTIPIHFDDYDVFLSPLEDFKAEVEKMGQEWKDRVVYLNRGDSFRFQVGEGNSDDLSGRKLTIA